jgi:hypothetical protein
MGLGDADQLFAQRLFYGRTYFGCGRAEPEFSGFGIMLQKTVAGQNIQQAAYGRFMEPEPVTDFRGAHVIVVWNKSQEDLQRLLHRMIMIGFFGNLHGSLEMCNMFVYCATMFPILISLLHMSVNSFSEKKDEKDIEPLRLFDIISHPS